MTANEELVKYIMELTPEKVKLLIDRLPEMLSALEELGLPVPAKQISPNQ